MTDKHRGPLSLRRHPSRSPARRSPSPPACGGSACRCPSRSTTSTCGCSRTATAGRSSTRASAWRRRGTLWEKLLAGPMGGRPVKRIVVTHYHPDHVGSAAWLARAHRRAGLDDGRRVPVGARRARRHRGLRPRHRHRLLRPERPGRLGHPGEGAHRQPLPARRAGAAAHLPAADARRHARDRRPRLARDLRASATRRSTRRSTARRSASSSPATRSCRASPPTSASGATSPRPTRCASTSTPSRASPTSPARCACCPRTTASSRACTRASSSSREHHAERLEKLLEAACDRPVTAFEVLPVLFRRKLDEHQMGFAMGEAIAHLHYLRGRGQGDARGRGWVGRFVRA